MANRAGSLRQRPIAGTSDFRNHVHLTRISVSAQDELSTKNVVVDETIGLHTGIGERLCSVILAVQETLIKPHTSSLHDARHRALEVPCSAG